MEIENILFHQKPVFTLKLKRGVEYKIETFKRVQLQCYVCVY